MDSENTCLLPVFRRYRTERGCSKQNFYIGHGHKDSRESLPVVGISSLHNVSPLSTSALEIRLMPNSVASQNPSNLTLQKPTIVQIEAIGALAFEYKNLPQVCTESPTHDRKSPAVG